MAIDPIDMLGSLPDYPGKTLPKNRGEVKKREHTDLSMIRATQFRLSGEVVNMYTIGELARAIGRKPVTIRMWESRGWIPRANYRTPKPAGEQIPGKATKGRRLYTQQQLEFLVKAVELFVLDERDPKTWDKFRQHVKANWPK